MKTLLSLFLLLALGASAATGIKISEYPNTPVLTNSELFIVAVTNVTPATNRNITYGQLRSLLSSNNFVGSFNGDARNASNVVASYVSGTLSNNISGNAGHLAGILVQSNMIVSKPFIFYGDSLTTGYGLTNIQNLYVHVISNTLSCPIDNRAVQGDRVADFSGPIWTLNVTNGMRTVYSFCLNDARDGYTNAGGWDTFQKLHLASIASLAIPKASRIAGTNWNKTGSWSTTSVFDGNGIYTATSNDTASVWGYGSTFILGCIGNDAGDVSLLSRFIVTIDGVPYITNSTACSLIAASSLPPYVPVAFAFTNLGDGPHTISVIASPTNSPNKLFIEWGAFLTGNMISTSPSVYVANVIPQGSASWTLKGGDNTNSLSINTAIRNNVSLLAKGGCKVRLVDWHSVNPSLQADGIHPDDAGSIALAQEELFVIGQAERFWSQPTDYAPDWKSSVVSGTNLVGNLSLNGSAILSPPSTSPKGVVVNQNSAICSLGGANEIASGWAGLWLGLTPTATNYAILQGPADDLFVNVPSIAGQIHFRSANGTDTMLIRNATHRVGINTITPAEALDVSGNISASGAMIATNGVVAAGGYFTGDGRNVSNAVAVAVAGTITNNVIATNISVFNRIGIGANPAFGKLFVKDDGNSLGVDGSTIIAWVIQQAGTAGPFLGWNYNTGSAIFGAGGVSVPIDFNTHDGSQNLRRLHLSADGRLFVTAPLTIYGDSIAAGVGAAPASQSWVNQLTTVSSIQVNNLAASGGTVEDMAPTIHALTTLNGDNYIYAYGANDQRAYPSPDGNNLFQAVHLASLTDLLVPDTNKHWATNTADFTYTGFWSNSAYYSGRGRVSTNYGAIAAITNVGRWLLVSTMTVGNNQVDKGMWELFVDGVSKGTNNGYFATNLYSFIGTLTNAPSTYLYDMSTDGIHGVQFKQVSGETNVYLEHIVFLSGDPQYQFPSVFCTKITPVDTATWGGTDANVHTINNIIRSNVTALATSGLNAKILDFFSCITTNDMGDGLHPNNTGHGKLATAAEWALAVDSRKVGQR